MYGYPRRQKLSHHYSMKIIQNFINEEVRDEKKKQSNIRQENNSTDYWVFPSSKHLLIISTTDY